VTLHAALQHIRAASLATLDYDLKEDSGTGTASGSSGLIGRYAALLHEDGRCRRFTKA
jgi:hypothetical protein